MSALPTSRSASSQATRMLVVLASGWATIQAGRFLLPPILPRITETLEFTPSEVGLTLTAFGLTGRAERAFRGRSNGGGPVLDPCRVYLLRL